MTQDKNRIFLNECKKVVIIFNIVTLMLRNVVSRHVKASVCKLFKSFGHEYFSKVISVS